MGRDCHATDGPPRPSVAIFIATGPPGPSMAAIDGLPGPSVAGAPLPQMVPLKLSLYRNDVCKGTTWVMRLMNIIIH